MPFGLSTVAAKAVGIGLLVLALLAGAAWLDLHVEAAGAAKYEARDAQQRARDIAAARSKDATIQAAQEAADHEADNFHLAATLDARDALDADRRLQQRFAAINASCLPEHPAAPPPGPAASSATDLRAYVLGRMGEASGQLAAYGDSARGAGLDTEQHYDALRPPAVASSP